MFVNVASSIRLVRLKKKKKWKILTYHFGICSVSLCDYSDFSCVNVDTESLSSLWNKLKKCKLLNSYDTDENTADIKNDVLVSENSVPQICIYFNFTMSLFCGHKSFSSWTGWPKMEAKISSQKLQIDGEFLWNCSTQDAFILVFQIRCFKTFLLYIIYQNNPVDCSLIDFSIGCYGTVNKRKEILAGHSFPHSINLGQIDLKTGYAWFWLVLSFTLHYWEKWKCKWEG